MNPVAMEGRLTAPPELQCSSQGSSSSCQKMEFGPSGTSSLGRSESSSNSSSAVDVCEGSCAMNHGNEQGTSAPVVPNATGEASTDVLNDHLLNIWDTMKSNDMLITDKQSPNLKEIFKNEVFPDDSTMGRLRTLQHTTQVACQTEMDSQYPPLVTLIRGNPLASISLADIATTSHITEGVLPLVIRNFSHMQETMRGPIMGIRGVPWRIMVMPRQHVVQKKGTQKCLGFFLQCCPTAYSDSWSCQATAELRLISQKPDVPNFTRKTNHSYTAKENDWGYSCFMTWADILDESQGYIKDNTVKVEVSVKADPPKNILDLAQFQKKVRDYIRLAEVQAKRGFIDKAIEVNTSATKFAKDKDCELKNELETQLKKLIELKLKQSIERIEKGNTSKCGEDDNSSNMNALRQAMGGGTAVRTQKAQKVVKKEGEVVTKEAVRKPMGIRAGGKFPPRIEEARREFEKVNQKSVVQCKSPLSKGTTTRAMPISSPKWKPNGTAHNKNLVASGKFSGSVVVSKDITALNYRPLFNEEIILPEVDEMSNASADNVSEPDMYLGDSQISVKLAAGSDEPDFNLHIAKVMETLKDISPDFHEAMRKTFQNPLAMAYSEEDSFIEELCGMPPVPQSSVQDSGVQTEEFFSTGDFWENAVVDAALCKSASGSPDDKNRKVKRVRKVRGTKDGDDMQGQSLPEDESKADSLEDCGEGKMIQEESGSPSESNSSHYAENIADHDNHMFGLTELEADDSLETTSHSIGPLPMSVAFEYMERNRDNDNPERPGVMQPGDELSFNTYADIFVRKNVMNVISLLTSNSRTIHIGVSPDIFKTFPGYNAERPLGQFEKQLVSSALNLVAVNCVNYSACIKKIHHFFSTLNSSSKIVAVMNGMHELNAVLKCKAFSANDNIKIPQTEFVLNPFDLNHIDEPEALLDKSQSRLVEYLKTEMRYITTLFDCVSFSEIVIDAIIEIKRLREENEDLKEKNEQTRARHQQLEQRKEKEIDEIRNSTNTDKDKITELSRQNREMKKEMKRLEKKCKSMESQATELAALRERAEKAEDRLTDMTTRFNELTSTAARDKQSWSDVRANHQREKQQLESELKNAKHQTEDARNATKKAEAQLLSERKAHQAALKSEKDRAIKAECAELEAKLEFGLKILERAHEDCKLQVKRLDGALAKPINPPSEAEAEVINKNITEWQRKAEEVAAIMTNSKSEFSTVINEVKKGKPLATMTKPTVPKPPPHPILHTMPVPPPNPVPQNTAPQNPGPSVSAIGSQRRGSPQAQYMGPYIDNGRGVSPNHHKFVTLRGSMTPQPMIPQFPAMSRQIPTTSSFVPMQHGRPSSTVGIPQSPNPKTTIPPIGVRPTGYNTKNGMLSSQPTIKMDNIENAAAMLSAATQNANRQMNHSPTMPPGFSSSGPDMFPGPGHMNSNRPQMSNPRNWYDPLNAYSDLFPTETNRWELGGFGGMSSSSSSRSNVMTTASNVSEPNVVPPSANSIPANRRWFENEARPS